MEPLLGQRPGSTPVIYHFPVGDLPDIVSALEAVEIPSRQDELGATFRPFEVLRILTLDA